MAKKKVDRPTERQKRTTRRGYETASESEREESETRVESGDVQTWSDTLPPVSGGRASSGEPWTGGRPISSPVLVEVEHIVESGPPSFLQDPWRAFEVWTHNHIYALDSSVKCLNVIERATFRGRSDHQVIGCRLIGGQMRDAEGHIIEVSHPLPGRGAAAVFERRIGNRVSFSETSPVTRVLMRLRVLHLQPSSTPPSWKKVTGSHS